jgi:hypothetical protein
VTGRVYGFLGLALSALALAVPAAATATPVLPDLVADAPDRPMLQEAFDVDTEPRRLLRFDGFVHNKGPGPFEITGSGPNSLEMDSVKQDILQSDNSWLAQTAPGARMQYETADGHDHWHLKEIATYSLVQKDSTALVAPAQKVGFCLLDSQRVQGTVPGYYGYSGVPWTNCATGHPDDVSSLTMGVSAGWRDLYDRTLWFQWVDVSHVAPGEYRLRSQIDTKGYVQEADEMNLPAYLPVVVPGYLAQAATLHMNADAPTPVELSARYVPADAQNKPTPRFRVDRLPAHGTLLQTDGTAVSPGEWLPGSALSYVPDPAHPGTQDFAFSAREAEGSGVARYPLSPPQATVVLDPQAAVARHVALSGAHDLVVGTSMQLQAQVDGGDPADLTWTASAGSVDSGGLYRAPAEAPAGGRVVVRAELSTGESDAVSFDVRPAPPALPAPTPDTPSAPPATPGTTPIIVPRLQLRAIRAGSAVSSSVLSRYTGGLRILLKRRGHTLAACKLQIRAGRSYVCRLPAHGRRSGLTVVAALRRPGGAVLRRSVAVRKAAPKSGHTH